MQKAGHKVVSCILVRRSFVGVPGAGLVTLFGRAFLASTLGIRLLNKTVCVGVCLFFNFESFVFDFGGISNQVVMDQTTRPRSFLQRSAPRHFRLPKSRTSTESKSKSGHIGNHRNTVITTTAGIIVPAVFLPLRASEQRRSLSSSQSPQNFPMRSSVTAFIRPKKHCDEPNIKALSISRLNVRSVSSPTVVYHTAALHTISECAASPMVQKRIVRLLCALCML